MTQRFRAAVRRLFGRLADRLPIKPRKPGGRADPQPESTRAVQRRAAERWENEGGTTATDAAGKPL